MRVGRGWMSVNEGGRGMSVNEGGKGVDECE